MFPELSLHRACPEGVGGSGNSSELRDFPQKKAETIKSLPLNMIVLLIKKFNWVKRLG
jgi:hypothetical protein